MAGSARTCSAQSGPHLFGGMVEEIPDWIKEAMERADEPLHEDLQPYLQDGGYFGTVLKHPLVFDIAYAPQRAYQSNDQYLAKREIIEKCMADHSWSNIIWLTERPYRVQAFVQISAKMDDEYFWRLLADVYSDTENFWQERNYWNLLLTTDRPRREEFMTEEERNKLQTLPDKLTIYRGYNGKGKLRSWAWTLDRDRAVWFAKRLHHGGKPPRVATGEVAKADVVAYLNGRNEEEIVVDPKNIKVSKTTGV